MFAALVSITGGQLESSGNCDIGVLKNKLAGKVMLLQWHSRN
jgi:hypothetical protein